MQSVILTVEYIEHGIRNKMYPSAYRVMTEVFFQVCNLQPTSQPNALEAMMQHFCQHRKPPGSPKLLSQLSAGNYPASSSVLQDKYTARYIIKQSRIYKLWIEMTNLNRALLQFLRVRKTRPQFEATKPSGVQESRNKLLAYQPCL